jgi:DNA-binding transcriptional LysR family regulator
MTLTRKSGMLYLKYQSTGSDTINDLQIDYFLALAGNLSFTTTAAELYVTQPAVSRQIASLEKELEVTLFDRTNRATQLTEAGKLFKNFFTEYRENLRKVKIDAKIMNENCYGSVRLGCLSNWNLSGFFPAILNTFKKKYPNISIYLECYGIKDLINVLKNDKLDIILTLEATLTGVSGLHVQKLMDIQKIILFSVNHPLALRENLTPADFKNEVFLVLSGEEVAYAKDLVISYCKPYGFTPKIRFVRNIESMLAGVQNGMGVAISDSWENATSNQGFSYVTMDSLHSIALAWKDKTDNKDISLLVNEFTLLMLVP